MTNTSPGQVMCQCVGDECVATGTTTTVSTSTTTPTTTTTPITCPSSSWLLWDGLGCIQILSADADVATPTVSRMVVIKMAAHINP